MDSTKVWQTPLFSVHAISVLKAIWVLHHDQAIGPMVNNYYKVLYRGKEKIHYENKLIVY